MTMQIDFTANVQIYFEHSVKINDNSYLIIFGHHINGGFIAIPNWSICCEASDHYDCSYYNQTKLMNAGMDEIIAKSIALHINSWIDNFKNR